MRWIIAVLGICALQAGNVDAQTVEPVVVCPGGLVQSPGGGCGCPAGLKLHRNGIGLASCVASTAETCVGSAQLLGNICVCPVGSHPVRNGATVSCAATQTQTCSGLARLVSGRCLCPASMKTYRLANGDVTCVSPPATDCPLEAQLVGGKCLCPGGTVTFQTGSGAVACLAKKP
jgi:hypothetical protein